VECRSRKIFCAVTKIRFQKKNTKNVRPKSLCHLLQLADVTRALQQAPMPINWWSLHPLFIPLAPPCCCCHGRAPPPLHGALSLLSPSLAQGALLPWLWASAPPQLLPVVHVKKNTPLETMTGGPKARCEYTKLLISVLCSKIHISNFRAPQIVKFVLLTF
jgi:hypothetical protein